jgi:hypothetical protein
VRVRISEPEFLPDLVEFLQARAELVVEQSREDEIEAALIGSYNEEAQGMVIELLVLAWQGAHPEVHVEVTRDADAS